MGTEPTNQTASPCARSLKTVMENFSSARPEISAGAIWGSSARHQVAVCSENLGGRAAAPPGLEIQRRAEEAGAIGSWLTALRWVMRTPACPDVWAVARAAETRGALVGMCGARSRARRSKVDSVVRVPLGAGFGKAAISGRWPRHVARLRMLRLRRVESEFLGGESLAAHDAQLVLEALEEKHACEIGGRAVDLKAPLPRPPREAEALARVAAPWTALVYALRSVSGRSSTNTIRAPLGVGNKMLPGSSARARRAAAWASGALCMAAASK